MNILEALPKDKCSGCGLCSEVCPKKCIAMNENHEGFLYPEIDKSKCIECQACVKKCPILSGESLFGDSMDSKYYAVIAHDKDLLKQSSSGGVFGILAKHLLDLGGSVCGCVYNENLEAVHVVTEDEDCVKRMYGSKYVQSNILNCYEPVKKSLQAGKKVLFTGTACQIAAIKSYLGREYSNLYTVDILCHGVPSPGLFRKFVKHLEKKANNKVVDIKFRDKSKNGWGSEHRTSVTYDNGKKKWPFMPAYFSAFFYGLSLRESCYKCKFAGVNRVSDMTIGDYWGSWKKYGKRFNEGISVVSVNTEKGFELFTTVRSDFSFLEEVTQKEAIQSNDNFMHAVKRPKERDSFYQDQERYSTIFWKTYGAKSYRKKVLASIYGAVVPEKIRLAVHRMLRK